MSTPSENVLGRSNLASVWNKISSLFLRKTDAATLYVKKGEELTSVPESVIEGEEPVVPVSMYVSGNKLVVISTTHQ